MVTASRFAWSPPPSASPKSLDYSLQVHLQTHTITASMYICQEQWCWYRDIGVTQEDVVIGSIYLLDPGLDRHHPISISFYHIMKIQAPSFPTFVLTRSVRDLVDTQCYVVLYLLTQFVRNLNQNHSIWWMLFRCHERCAGVLMVGSLCPSVTGVYTLSNSTMYPPILSKYLGSRP